MRVLIRGAGDLATGIAWELVHAGHRVVMTEIAVPLTVRRQVACSRAVYEGTARVEDLLAVRVENMEEIRKLWEAEPTDRSAAGSDAYTADGAAAADISAIIPVIVDPEGEIRRDFLPDVIVDCIMAKRNLGTKISDAPRVIGIGPGFTARVDCHAVIETVRGPFLGQVITEGSAIPDTGVPGEIAGFSVERLLKSTAAGRMEPVAKIGDLVEKDQIVAYTGGEPVRAKLTGLVRGMLQEGVMVKNNMKIGDVDARTEIRFAYTISDKAHRIGRGVLRAMDTTA